MARDQSISERARRLGRVMKFCDALTCSNLGGASDGILEKIVRSVPEDVWRAFVRRTGTDDFCAPLWQKALFLAIRDLLLVAIHPGRLLSTANLFIKSVHTMLKDR